MQEGADRFYGLKARDATLFGSSPTVTLLRLRVTMVRRPYKSLKTIAIARFDAPFSSDGTTILCHDLSLRRYRFHDSDSGRPPICWNCLRQSSSSTKVRESRHPALIFTKSSRKTLV